LQGALEHRSLIEQAVEILVDREGLDAPAALGVAENGGQVLGIALVQMARAVLVGRRSL
jgi:hypothetical protein